VLPRPGTTFSSRPGLARAVASVCARFLKREAASSVMHETQWIWAHGLGGLFHFARVRRDNGSDQVEGFHAGSRGASVSMSTPVWAPEEVEPSCG
jgi:hypothetical protein